MRRYLGIALFLLLCTSAFGRQRAQGNCEQGGTTITTSGLSSTQKVQQSFPSCTVTVYQAGTLVLATIYSDNAGTPLANPFTAAAFRRTLGILPGLWALRCPALKLGHSHAVHALAMCLLGWTRPPVRPREPDPSLCCKPRPR
jgi:hypothetical protein